MKLQLVGGDLPPAPPRRSAHGRFGLTRREADVANLVAEGFDNKAIAAKVGTTVQVVKNYLSHVFDKVGCSNRVELATTILLGRENPR